MIFRTAFTAIGGNNINTNVGSPIKATYKMTVGKDGKRELKKSGEFNLDAEIQSYKEGCSIEYILQRFVNGDETALSKVQGVYGDFTHMPTNLQELQQRIIDAEQLFLQLPLDIRAKFNHSASEFFNQLESDKTKAILGIKKDVVEDNLKKDVVEEVTKDVVEEVTKDA